MITSSVAEIRICADRCQMLSYSSAYYVKTTRRTPCFEADNDIGIFDAFLAHFPCDFVAISFQWESERLYLFNKG